MCRTRQVTRSSIWRTACSILWESRFCHMTLEQRRYYVTTCRLRAPALHRTIRPVSSPTPEECVFRRVLFKIKLNPDKMSRAGFYSRLSLSSWRVCLPWRAWRSGATCVAASPAEEALAHRTGAAAADTHAHTHRLSCADTGHTIHRHGPVTISIVQAVPPPPQPLLLCCFFFSTEIESPACLVVVRNDQERTSPPPGQQRASRERRRDDPRRCSVQSREEEAKDPGVVRRMVSTGWWWWGARSIVTWKRWPARPF